jgi:hypothetical protein
VVTPYTDDWWNNVKSVWTFDLDCDILRFDKRDKRLVLPLKLVRERTIQMSDFEPYELPPIHYTPNVLKNFGDPCTIKRKTIDIQLFQRRKAFISKILAEFAFQWRHILCGRYNNYTFRRLAYAILRIVTLDFTVEEVTLPREGSEDVLVGVEKLPEWDFAREHIIRVGDVSIVVCQHPNHAEDMILEDFNKQFSHCLTVKKCKTYLILSVRDIFICRRTGGNRGGTFNTTEPARLFDGLNSPSDEAIDFLLQATLPSVPRTWFDKLPLELQDLVLNQVPAGSIERARVGCLLEAGSIFTWKSGGRSIERVEECSSRTRSTPVESHIYFGEHRSGVAYK